MKNKTEKYTYGNNSMFRNGIEVHPRNPAFLDMIEKEAKKITDEFKKIIDEENI